MVDSILPSRKQLLERIEMQFAYQLPLVILIGEVGVGKSYVLDRFLTDKFESYNKALVTLAPTTTEQQLYSQLLEQIFHSPIIDYSMTLLENFNALYQSESGELLIVIDNGNHLTPEFCAELEAVVQFYESKIKVLISSTRQLAFGHATRIHIEALNQEESYALLALHNETLPNKDEPVFKSYLESCDGNPKLLLDWRFQDEVKQKQQQIKTKQAFIYSVLILCLMVVVGGVSALYYYDKDKQIAERKKQDFENLTRSSQVKTVIAAPDIASNEQTNEVVQKQSVESVVASEEQADTVSKLGQTSNTESHQDNESLLNRSVQLSEQSNLSVAKVELEPESIPKTQTSKEQNNQDFAQKQNDSIEEQAQAELKQQNSNDSLFDLPDNHYMLQLIAAADSDIVDGFIGQHADLDIKIYSTVRYGGQWYVAYIGPYTTYQQAQQAKSKLSAEVLKLQPFAKSLATIKREINQ